MTPFLQRPRGVSAHQRSARPNPVLSRSPTPRVPLLRGPLRWPSRDPKRRGLGSGRVRDFRRRRRHLRRVAADDTTQPDGPPELYVRIVELGERLHDQELASADNIGARAGTLIGFAGVVLALTVALSRDAFTGRTDLGEAGDLASVILFLLAVLSLLVCALLAVQAAAPRNRDRISPSVLSTYREEKPAAAALDEHFGRRQQEVIETMADTNSTRGKTLQCAFRWLLGALVLVAAQAAIIGVDRLLEVL